MAEHEHDHGCDHDHDKVAAMSMVSQEEVLSTYRQVTELHMGLLMGVATEDPDQPIDPEAAGHRELIMTMVHQNVEDEDEKVDYFFLEPEHLDHFFSGMCMAVTESPEEAKLLYQSFHKILAVMRKGGGE